MSLLKQNTIKKGQVDKNAIELAELDAGKDSGKYEIEAICDNAIDTRKSAGHLPKLYFLVFCKVYLEEKNT